MIPPSGTVLQHDSDSAAMARLASRSRVCRALAQYPWDTWASISALVLTCAFLLSLPYAEPDLWGHVQYGMDWLHDGLPQTTTYSYTAEGYPWINHENLSELVMAVTYMHLGVPGLLVGKCLLGLVILSIFAGEARRRHVSWLTIAGTCTLAATTLSSFWQTRPQLASYFLFTLLIVVLGRAFEGWQGEPRPLKQLLSGEELTPAPGRRRHAYVWLWALPVLFAVWANSHGGFVAGMAVLFAYVGVRIVEVVFRRRWRAWPTVTILVGALGLAALSTFMTPYGIRLHAWLIASLGAPRPEITEWAPLSFATEAFVPFLALLLITVVGLSAGRRSLDLAELVVLLVVGWQSVAHQRHIPFFVILTGLWLPPHWESLVVRVQQKCQLPAAWTSQHKSRWMLGVMAGVNTVLLIALVPRLITLRVDRSVYPVDAIHFMADRQLNGRLVVTYNWAQYAIAALGTNDAQKPGIRVAFDGRFRTCYPPEVLDHHFDFVFGDQTTVGRHRNSHSPLDPTRALHFGNPNLVLVSRLQVPSVRVMQQQSDQWALLYQDALAQVWGRKSEFDNPSHPHYLPPNRRVVHDAAHEGIVQWPALPKSWQTSTTVVAGERSEPTRTTSLDSST